MFGPTVTAERTRGHRHVQWSKSQPPLTRTYSNLFLGKRPQLTREEDIVYDTGIPAMYAWKHLQLAQKHDAPIFITYIGHNDRECTSHGSSAHDRNGTRRMDRLWDGGAVTTALHSVDKELALLYSQGSTSSGRTMTIISSRTDSRVLCHTLVGAYGHISFIAPFYKSVAKITAKNITPDVIHGFSGFPPFSTANRAPILVPLDLSLSAETLSGRLNLGETSTKRCMFLRSN